jgi:hypothetical protein
MYRDPSEDYKNNAAQYLKDIEPDFLFDHAHRIYKPKAYYDAQEPSRLKKFWKNCRQYWLAIIINVLTLAAVAYYAYYARLQWSEMKRTADQSVIAAGAAQSAAVTADQSLKDTKANFANDQRPYLWTTKSSSVPKFDAKKGEIYWNCVLEDYGKTPALHIRFKPYMKIGDKPFILDPHQRKVSGDGAAAPPGTETLWVSVHSLPMTLDEANRVLGIDEAVQIKVVLDYTGVYGGDFETSFCYANLADHTTSSCDHDNYIK